MPARVPTPPPNPHGLNPQQRAFARAYVSNGGNATQAAITAGYSADSAPTNGPRLLQHAGVQAFVMEIEERAARRAEVDFDLVVSELRDIALADPRELIEAHHDACRYCHGEGHDYHWRTPEEFDEAWNAWARKEERKAGSGGIEPTNAGGFGYRATREPHPDCPRCEGRGTLHVEVKDTRLLSREARRLYAGVKVTEAGVQVLMHDQIKALEALGRVVGIYAEDNRQKAPLDTLIADLAQRIQSVGSRAPIRTIEHEGER